MNLLLALLTGVSLFLVHPRFSLWWLAPFAPVPLLLAVHREWRPKHRFLIGYASGFVFWAGLCYWIHSVMSIHGRMGPWLGGVVFVLFCLLKGLHLAFFAMFAGVLIHHRFAAISIPCLWVIIERIPDPFGFLWLPLGNAALTLSLPLRTTPFTGVYGASFLFAVMATVVALLILRRPRIELAPALLLLVPALLPSLPEAEAGREIAVSVQPSISDRDDWTLPSFRQVESGYEQMSVGATQGAKPLLLLWPEVPAPFYYDDDADLRNRVARVASLTGASVLLGTVAHDDTKAPLNSAQLVTPSGSAAGRYDKMSLVPFGEYVPFPFGTLAGKVTSEIGDFVPGTKPITFALGKEKLGAFICYESAFPNQVRHFARNGAGLLANLSNDGYFGRSAAREQHLALVRMRAVENRRWILRATNDGITAAVDPAGRVVNRFPDYQSMAGRLPFNFHYEQTVYTQWGDWFAWICGAAAIAFLVASQWPHYTASAQPRK